MTYDVAIIGGGLAGTSAAYFLSESGLSVALFEADELGSGATSKTTAMISQMIDTAPSALIRMLGLRDARLAWDAGARAIDAIEQAVKKEKIECHFLRVPAYVYANSDKEYKALGGEQKAMRKLGSKAMLQPSSFLPFQNAGSLELPQQAKFSIQPYLEGLAKAAKRHGAKLSEHTQIKNVVRTPHGFVMQAGRRMITAEHLLIATYQPFKNPTPTHFKKGMYASYCFEVQIPAGRIPEAIYWDLQSPYHYFRIDPGEHGRDTLIIGGEDHRADIRVPKHKNFKALEEALDSLLQGIPHTITNRWTGPILEPSDGLPLIGAYEPHAYVATAFSGNGMTYSTITGLLIRDLIHGKKNAWARIYDPLRGFKMRRLAQKGIDYSRELIGGAVKNTLRK